MTTDTKTLATRYIEDVIDDQRKLGYTGEANPEARERATDGAEAALRDLAASAGDSKNTAGA